MAKKIAGFVDLGFVYILGFVICAVSTNWLMTEFCYGYVEPFPPPPEQTMRGGTDLSPEQQAAILKELSQQFARIEVASNQIASMQQQIINLRRDYEGLSILTRQTRENRITMLESQMDNVIWWLRAVSAAVLTHLGLIGWSILKRSYVLNNDRGKHQ